MNGRRVKKLREICYATLSSASTDGFDGDTSDVEARLRYILTILPKSMQIEYANCMWNGLRTAIGRRDHDTYGASNDDADEGLKHVTGLVRWHTSTKRIISVISEYIGGYRPPKRYPSYCCICWPYGGHKSGGPRAKCNCTC